MYSTFSTLKRGHITYPLWGTELCEKDTQLAVSFAFTAQYLRLCNDVKPHAIIENMTLKHDLQSYKARWNAVEEIQAEERRSASIELRWRQLNAAYGMAKGLGLLQSDLSEMEVFKRWAKLKEKATGRPPRV